MARINDLINNSRGSCELKGCYLRKKIKKRGDDFVELESGERWRSRKLAAFLEGSDELFVMAVTAGERITEERDRLIGEGSAFEPVILDSLGSEMAEAAADWLHNYLGQGLLRTGLKCSRLRYSPGYGDFELENQRSIFKLLNLESLGLTLSESFLMLPEKSITALIGIEKLT